ncbi:hypothetical protein Ccrd_001436 [Cynara cardunculus var. scolymus]|uniref:Nucleotide-binding, alpha-beta plait n=1 Tax=Cynara cardunculus var. scolymus TaxID=59895 RepID=A0A103XTC3_CYNCS|nr:hypothetical protein Ccrd_001436 [Cynara cardunculus var. scolymus]
MALKSPWAFSLPFLMSSSAIFTSPLQVQSFYMRNGSGGRGSSYSGDRVSTTISFEDLNAFHCLRNYLGDKGISIKNERLV